MKATIRASALLPSLSSCTEYSRIPDGKPAILVGFAPMNVALLGDVWPGLVHGLDETQCFIWEGVNKSFRSCSVNVASGGSEIGLISS